MWDRFPFLRLGEYEKIEKKGIFSLYPFLFCFNVRNGEAQLLCYIVRILIAITQKEKSRGGCVTLEESQLFLLYNVALDNY